MIICVVSYDIHIVRIWRWSLFANVVNFLFESSENELEEEEDDSDNEKDEYKGGGGGGEEEVQYDDNNDNDIEKMLRLL